MQRTWTIVAVGATVVGLGLGGAAVASADAGPSAEPVQPISVGAADPAFTPVAQIVDDSPESVDSPFESPVDSPESPFDSPDDDQFTPDTPDDLTPDTPDTPDDD